MDWKERIQRFLGLSSEEEQDCVSTLNLSYKGITKLPLEIGQLTNLTTLDLSWNKLSSLPAQTGQLTKLTTLDLSSNQLSSLPAQIGQLTNLTTLSLRWNKLSTLPTQIGQLTNLTTLSLYWNKLRSLPAEIGQLTNLTELNLERNKLRSLPAEIGQLTNLTELNLERNQLSSLPAEIGQLTNLTRLLLYNNQLSSLPAEIGQLTNLTAIYLWGNQLSSLPAEIGQLTNVTELSLYGNQLSSLPAEIGKLTNLIELDLRKNQLSTLPPEIAQLTNLERLDLRHNPLPIPPEILEHIDEPATILDYYFRESRKPLNEGKLVLVGEGRVGKTSLVRRLVEKQFDPYERITEGIAIKNWKVTVHDTEIRVNVWDFGGQEIMHATHQFFLTLRTLYVLVLDVQQDEARNRLAYWLKLIESFGTDSPIIVVSNQIDQPSKLYLNQGELIKKHAQIKAFVETSCQSGEGMAKLEARITSLMGSLAHVRDEIPVEWLAVKSGLEGLGKDYVAYDDYVGLCEANDVRKEREQRVLIRLLHDLGVVLNFQDDARLSETSVLNPSWVTGGVYKIINAKQIRENRGILEIGQLDEILDRARYPKEMDWFIILMMRKFELCFDLEGHTEEKFLIPDLFPRSEPPLSWQVGTLNFEYHYDFWPRSVISRFMVRLHGFISQDTYWHHGVLLVNNANRALVHALPRSKKIVISISGVPQGRLEFWTMIREQFDEIHQSIKGLNARVEIPVYKPPTCPSCGTVGSQGAKFCQHCEHRIPVARHKEPICQGCGAKNRKEANFCLRCGIALSAYVVPAATVDYRFLLNLQQKGIEQHHVPVRDDVVLLNVRELLEGVKPAPKAAEREEIGTFKKLLEPLRLRVHPQKYYRVTFLLGQLYYEEMDDYTLARQALVDGHEAIEALRGMVEEEIQLRLSAQSVKLYEMLVRCYLVEGDQNKAFEYAATAKGRAFVNRLAEARVDLQSLAAERPDFASKLALARQKRQEIDDFEKQIGAQAANRDELLGKQSVLLREEAELWREMAREYPVLTATLTVPTLSAAQARALAKELDATLVEYYRHSEGSALRQAQEPESGWCAFVVTSKQIRHVPLPRLDGQLLKRLANWRNNVHRVNGRHPRRHRRLEELYEAVVAPLGLEKLTSRRVVFAPFRELHLLPLAAAYDAARKRPERQRGRYLAEGYVISYSPSLTALYVVSQEQKRRQSSALRQAQEPGFERLLSVVYPGAPASPDYLPNVLEEAEAIEARLSGMTQVDRLSEEEATPDEVLKRAPDYDVIHFGCHGRFDSRSPDQSGLMLAQKPLTVAQIITKLNLKRTRLTTLAACLTGQVALREGEEHVGLLQAMMTAGVQTVVASLWAVDDAATRALFEAFYTRQATLNAPAEAMRDACQLLRNTEAWQHPYYWAAFAVNGLATPRSFRISDTPWPPTDLSEQIEHYTRQRTRERSQMMAYEPISEAELLLDDLLDERQEVLHALKQHQLSQNAAAQRFPTGELGIAYALHLLVQDNPALQEFVAQEMRDLNSWPDFVELGEKSRGRRSIGSEEHQEAQKLTTESVKPPQTDNSISDFRDHFMTLLEQEPPPEEKTQSLIERLFGRFFS